MEQPSSNHASNWSVSGTIPMKTWVKLWTAGTLLVGVLVLCRAPGFSLASKQHGHNLRSTMTSTSTLSLSSWNEEDMSRRVLANNNTAASAVEGSCGPACCSLCTTDAICGTEEANDWISEVPFGLSISFIAFLLALSALFSGLTLGLMSLDSTGLEIVMSGDDPQNAAYAKKIYPIRKEGNLLLCTLILGNVCVNSFLSILMSSYAGGAVGLVTSTILIVIFGEITPQAVCSRFPLWIGSSSIPIVKAIRFFMYPVAKPLAFCLDKFLGRELVSTYSGAEMLKLLEIHLHHNVIDKDTAGAMTGALTYKNFAVKEIMTPLERTYMLNVDEKLSFETVAMIFKTGFSRIPVYEISPNNICGLLFVKDLIFIDPEDETPVRSFIQIFGREVHVVWPDDKLGDVLSELKKGKSHLAVVRDVNNQDSSQDPFYEVKGIITLEDIIEKIIGDTIVDETDAFVDNTQSMKVDREEGFEWARLRLLDAKIVDQMLTFEEAKAVTGHLRQNYEESVKLLTNGQLERLVAETPVTKLSKAKRELGKDLPDDLLYQKGKQSDFCTLILSGRVTIFVGSDNFRSEVSSWTLLGVSALADPSYKADFTAYVSDAPCRCLHFTYARFSDAVEASALERQLEVDSKMAAAVLNSPPPTADGLLHSESATGHFPGEGIPVGDHKNRRIKLIAALQIFKKDSSPEKALSDPEENYHALPESQEAVKTGPKQDEDPEENHNSLPESQEAVKTGPIQDKDEAGQESVQKDESSVKSA